jgi:hypothetical protein
MLKKAVEVLGEEAEDLKLQGRIAQLEQTIEEMKRAQEWWAEPYKGWRLSNFAHETMKLRNVLKESYYTILALSRPVPGGALDPKVEKLLSDIEIALPPDPGCASTGRGWGRWKSKT